MLLRSLTQDLLSEHPKPQTDDARLLAAAASLVELLALRLRQPPPPWAKDVGALPEPMHLLKATASMKRLRALCETEAPEPLRKRGFYAPPTSSNSLEAEAMPTEGYRPCHHPTRKR